MTDWKRKYDDLCDRHRALKHGYENWKVLGTFLIFGLLVRRNHAKRQKDWATADSIRSDLEMAGLEIQDTETTTEWRIIGTTESGEV